MRPCCYSCKCPEETSIGLVEVGANAEKELAFNVINNFCSGVGTCCGAVDEEEDNVNMIVPPADGWSRDDYKMMVEPSPRSYCKDFLMEAAEMLYEEIMDDEEGGEGIMKDAKEFVGKMKDIKDEMEGIKEDKETFDEMKERGYKEINTSCSKWKVEFPSEFTHEEKSAAVLFMSDMMPRALRGEHVFKTKMKRKKN